MPVSGSPEILQAGEQTGATDPANIRVELSSEPINSTVRQERELEAEEVGAQTGGSTAASESGGEDSDGASSIAQRSDGSEESGDDNLDSEPSEEEVPEVVQDISSLAAVEETTTETKTSPTDSVAAVTAGGVEGHVRSLASVPPPLSVPASTYPAENLPPRTGIQIPMLENMPEYIRAVPSRPELLYTSPEALFDDIVRQEADRISHPELVRNRTVYDSVDPNPETPAPPEPLKHADSGKKPTVTPYYTPSGPEDRTLIFESRFESGNLRRAVQAYEFEYDLILNPDYNTKVHTQWYLFSVSNTRAGHSYRFNIINMVKPTSVYNEGMRPLKYSSRDAAERGIGWVRCGENIAYYQNGIRRSKDKTSGGDKGTNYFTLTFTVNFERDNDTVYFSHCFPYTYTDLQKDLQKLENDPAIARLFRRRKLCETLAGNACDLITITSFNSDPAALRSRRAVVITARVHPGESNASWIMKGILDYLTGTSLDARILRDNFVFKIIPMLNPDGVIVGNYRCSLAGTDLNRQWGEPSRKMHPTIFFAKSMIRHLMHDREVVLFVDIHGHSRKKNVFMYGNNESQSIQERIFPRLLAKTSDCFCFDDCCWKIQKSKESTARVVAYRELTITNAFTLEASFCGADFGALADQHFTTRHLEEMGYMVCDAILDFCDPDQSKVQVICKELQLLFPDDGNSDDVSDSEVDEAERARQRRKRAKKKLKEKAKKKRSASKRDLQAERELQAKHAQEQRDRVTQELIAEGLAVGDGSLAPRDFTESDRLRAEWRGHRVNRENRDRGWGHQDASDTDRLGATGRRSNAVQNEATREHTRDTDARGRKSTKKKRKETTKEKASTRARDSSAPTPMVSALASQTPTSVTASSSGTQPPVAAISQCSTRSSRSSSDLQLARDKLRKGDSAELGESCEPNASGHGTVGRKKCSARASALATSHSESPRGHSVSGAQPEIGSGEGSRGAPAFVHLGSSRLAKQLDNTRV